MREMFKLFACLLIITGCASPVTTVNSVDSRPSISLQGVSGQSELYVDGIKMGRAVYFTKPNQLKLEAGTHQVKVMESGNTIFEQLIFIESEHKTIAVR